MAALTWREVSAPNFSGANDSFRTANQLQANALAGLGEAIKQYRDQQTAAADGTVLARALQISDPAQFQKAVADGSLLAGVNPNTLSPRTMATLGSRAGDLQQMAARAQDMAQQGYKFSRDVALNDRQDAARVASARQLGITDPSIAALLPEQQMAMQKGTLDLATAQQGLVRGNQQLRLGEQQYRAGEQDYRAGELGIENQAFRNRTQQRDDFAAETGMTAGINILRQSGSPQDALAKLETMNDLSPREFDAARRYIEASTGNLYAPVAGGAQPSGRPGTKAGSPYDATFNFQGTSAPISSQPISSVLEVQEASKTSQGHSPMGAFQINKATLEGIAPEVLGENWKNQEFTPEVQERLAKALFDKRKGGDLTKTWASLPNSSPGAYKDMPWEQMRGIIAQGEVGKNLPSDPASLRMLSQQSQFEATRRAAQNDSVGVVADVAKNLSDTRPVGEIVQEAIKTQFPNADQGDLLGMVNKIQRDNPGLSAADAMSAISRSARNSAWWRRGTTTFGDNVGVDNDVLRTNIQSLKDGKADYLSNANQLTRAQTAAVANAQERFDAATQNLLDLQQRQELQPGISTERARKAVQSAEAALKKAINEQRSNPNYRSVRQ